MPASFPTRITVFYGHIASNIGDLAINTGTIELIRRCIPGARIEFVLLNAEKSQFLETGRASFGDDPGVTLHHLYAHSSKAKEFLDRPERLFEDCGVSPPECVVLAAGEHLFDYGDGENHKSLFWRLLPLYLARGMAVTGVDISQAMLDEARRALGPQAEAVTMLRGDAQCLPFAVGTFDGVVSVRFLGSIIPFAQVAPVLREMRRVARSWAIVRLNNRVPGLPGKRGTSGSRRDHGDGPDPSAVAGIVSRARLGHNGRYACRSQEGSRRGRTTDMPSADARRRGLADIRADE